MLYLLFRLGAQRYALAAPQIVEVLPLMATRPIPGTPAWVSGVVNFRGQIVPALDLTLLALGTPARTRLSTRTVVVEYPMADAPARWLALIVEQATETLSCEPDAFAPTGIDTPEAPYLGPVMQDVSGLIQRVDVAQLLPDAVKALLFSAEVSAP